MTNSTASRGRPRDPGTDQAILDAALELLAAEGYSGMSLDQVASAAGVTRPTIYRRWSSKAELASAAIEQLHRSDRVKVTGDVRADLMHELSDIRRTFERFHGMAMVGALLIEEERHPELIAAWRERVVAPRRVKLQKLIEHGMAVGVFRPTIDPHAAVVMLVGAYYAQYAAGDPFPDTWEASIVDALMAGLGTEGAPQSG